jgi:glutathione synthase
MKKIDTPLSQTVAMRAGELRGGLACSEFGFFSAYLADARETHVAVNEFTGFVARTKFQGVHEGGVYAGYACIDSVALV